MSEGKWVVIIGTLMQYNVLFLYPRLLHICFHLFWIVSEKWQNNLAHFHVPACFIMLARQWTECFLVFHFVYYAECLTIVVFKIQVIVTRISVQDILCHKDGRLLWNIYLCFLYIPVVLHPLIHCNIFVGIILHLGKVTSRLGQMNFLKTSHHWI